MKRETTKRGRRYSLQGVRIERDAPPQARADLAALKRRDRRRGAVAGASLTYQVAGTVLGGLATRAAAVLAVSQGPNSSPPAANSGREADLFGRA